MSKGKLAYWNYRIIHRIQDEEETYSLHEVYYEEDDKLFFVTKRAVPVFGESVDSLKEKILSAFEKPVLEYDDFGKSLDK